MCPAGYRQKTLVVLQLRLPARRDHGKTLFATEAPTSLTEVRAWPCARGLTAIVHVEIAMNFGRAQRPLNPCGQGAVDLISEPSLPTYRNQDAPLAEQHLLADR